MTDENEELAMSFLLKAYTQDQIVEALDACGITYEVPSGEATDA